MVVTQPSNAAVAFAIYFILIPLAAFIVTIAWPLALPVGFLQLWGLGAVAAFVLDFICAAIKTGGAHR